MADVFISHASEDKEEVARPLAEALRQQGLVVWYDDYVLRLGDSLRRVIEKGLSSARFGVVILSPSFAAKEWPQAELSALLARENSDGAKILLPVWHRLTAEEVVRHFPLVADKVAVSTSRGLDHVVRKIVEAVGSPVPARMPMPDERAARGWKSRRWALLGVAGLIALLLGSGATWIYRWTKSERSEERPKLLEPVHQGASDDRDDSPVEAPKPVEPSVDTEPGKPPASTPASPPLGLTVRAEPASKSGTYQVRLGWQAPATPTEFEMVRTRLDGTQEVTAIPVPRPMGWPESGPVSAPLRTFVDADVLPVTRYRYTVRASGSNGGEPATVEVEIPGNEVRIRGRQRLADLGLPSRLVHRLVLEPGAELLTEGQDLALELVELVSRDAVIQTFPAGSVADLGHRGRSGGSISIRALRAEGGLTLVGRGERGGKGIPGKRGDKGKEGEPGSDSVSRPGSAKEGDPGCEQEAGNGGDGHIGGKGVNGGLGFPGGDSARVEIVVAHAPAFVARTELVPGEGGEGGDAGAGGPGGKGGKPGGTTGRCTQKAKKGMDGGRGPDGVKDGPGPAGQRLACCIMLGAQTFPGCGECGR